MQSFNFNPSHSHSLQDLDLQMEVMHHFADQNPSFLETLNFGGFSLENCSSQDQQQQQQQQQHLFQTTTYAHHGTNQIPIQTALHENKRRKVIDQSKSSSSNISPMNSPSGSGVYGENRKKKILGKGKKEMKSEENMEETDDFIHVRARRGQATDSHSLAERVRRAKINNKLKCLQNLVPGCHETMGMAGTLDEIINYVHSLQNQVEFLSMELAAASSCYELSPKPEATRKAQSLQDCEMMQECKISSDMDRRGTNSHEMEVLRDRIGELTCFRSSTWTL